MTTTMAMTTIMIVVLTKPTTIHGNQTDRLIGFGGSFLGPRYKKASVLARLERYQEALDVLHSLRASGRFTTSTIFLPRFAC